MPPAGLYPVSRHHLYGRHTNRARFNTADFDQEKSDKTKIVADAATIVAAIGNDVDEGTRAADVKIKDKKDKDQPHEKPGHKTDKKLADYEASQAMALHSAPNADSPVQKKKRGRPRKSEPAKTTADDEVAKAMARHSVPGVTPPKKRGRPPKSESAKGSKLLSGKRKRKSETNSLNLATSENTTKGSTEDQYLLGDEWVQTLRNSMNEVGAQFKRNAGEPLPKRPKNPQTTENLVKNIGIEDNQKDTTVLGSTSTADPRASSGKKRKPRRKSDILPNVQREEVPELRLRVANTSYTVAPRQSAPPETSLAMARTTLTPTTRKPSGASPQQQRQQPNTGSLLKSANPKTLTQPLSDGPKPRPVSHLRGASVATSTGSLPSSTSTKTNFEYFDRFGTPYSRSAAAVDPFVTPDSRNRTSHETHEEANMNVFNEMYSAVQEKVNFTEEQIYLDAHLDWRQQNDLEGPLSCLGQASGCTASKERTIRREKEEDVIIEEQYQRNRDIMHYAKTNTAYAEELLVLATRACVPFPIAQLKGTWTLYCPKYAEDHFDRYGYGDRTLTISSVGGFAGKNVWGARLNIAPRPTLYSIRTFTAPPHASFRKNTLKTVDKGYEIEIVFLGNGYLLLRLDLKLLLSGKTTEAVGERKMWMEFIGVHENAVKWAEEVDEVQELEKEGKRLFARYDGADD
ncbi:hypothetical protein EJ04DRAFT_561249 [Polyplosphaeria fusca]|uniref:Uncharacterized protein n=1 Tax=Polyplosphaeria fusca TaxID=682080 RepID=A0A9P4R7E5_9PLEO|nr:hypothetical protein EJ04DRAFT_561249 [Polyplosphaeria fusca]